MKKVVNEKIIRPWGVIYTMRRMRGDKRFGISVAFTEGDPREGVAWKLRAARRQLRDAMKYAS